MIVKWLDNGLKVAILLLMYNNYKTYKTFIRSCTSFATMAKARKITQDTGLCYEEARNRCDAYNANRTARQIAKGTKMEFTQE